MAVVFLGIATVLIANAIYPAQLWRAVGLSVGLSTVVITTLALAGQLHA